MRVLFYGTPAFALPTLEGLLAHHQVVGVVTQPDKPAGRGRPVIASPVKRRALEAGVPVLQPPRLRDAGWPERLAELAPDVAVVAAFGQILPKPVLDVPPRGSINVHASLLPRYRGAAPIAWSIIRGEAESGVTTFQMDPGMDTGDMLLREATPIGPEETAGELSERLARIGGRLLLRTLEEIDTLPRVPQDTAQATLAPRLKKEDGWLRPAEPARDLANRVRGCNPWPGAALRTPAGRLLLWRARALPDSVSAPPGTLIPLSPQGRGQGEGQRVEGQRVEGQGRGAKGRGAARHRHRLRPPPPAGSPAREPQGHALGRLPPRRSARGGCARDGARPMSPVLKAGPVSQARYEALHILVRVERDRAFADIALEHALDRARLDPRDAALCTEIVYGTLRWRRHLDWRLAPHLNRPLAKLDPWVRALLRLTLYQLVFLDRVPRWAAVDEAVSVARLKSRTPGPAEFVNAVLRSFTRAPGPPRPPASPVEAAGVRWSVPDWMAGRWIARLGAEEAGRLMAALNERPPTTIRANTLRISRDDLAARLRDEELAETDPTPLAPEGLTVRRGAIGRWAAFAAGWCAIQDEASMLVARLLDPQPGDQVADTCAAPGTKTTHLAQLMGNRGRIVAMDPHAARLRLLTQAAARLGIDIVETHAGGVGAVGGRWKGRCDRVLVDAPCSNLGVLRRNPDVKWKREEADLGRLAEKQRGILTSAAALARPGARLVYATCSLEPEENDEIVREFLRAHPGWGIDAPTDFPVPPDADGFVRCLPHVHGTDGFTAVRLARAGRP